MRPETKFLVDVVREGSTAAYWTPTTRRIEFMKPRTFDAENHLISNYRYVTAKTDGYRVLAIRSFDTQKLHVVTTDGTDIGEKVLQCHWAHQLWKRTTDLQWFDGEIYLQNEGREAVSTALANRDNDIRFAVIGCSHCPRVASMQEIERAVKQINCGLDVPAWDEFKGEPTGQLVLSNQEEPTVASLLASVKKLGSHYDGVVLKNGMYDTWLKIKHTLTIDLVVLAIQPAKPGKFEGMCGSLICGVQQANVATQVARVGGMDDAIRASISDGDIGRVVEVAYERVGTRGNLQHPRFIAWRDDKAPDQCGPEQDPELLKYFQDDDEEDREDSQG